MYGRLDFFPLTRKGLESIPQKRSMAVRGENIPPCKTIY